MLQITTSLIDKTPHHPGVSQVREILTDRSIAMIADSRIRMMLMMTRGDVNQAALMALGYIIQRLEILLKTDPRNKVSHEEHLLFYQNLLDEKQKTLR